MFCDQRLALALNLNGFPRCAQAARRNHQQHNRDSDKDDRCCSRPPGFITEETFRARHRVSQLTHTASDSSVARVTHRLTKLVLRRTRLAETSIHPTFEDSERPSKRRCRCIVGGDKAWVLPGYAAGAGHAGFGFKEAARASPRGDSTGEVRSIPGYTDPVTQDLSSASIVVTVCASATRALVVL